MAGSTKCPSMGTIAAWPDQASWWGSYRPRNAERLAWRPTKRTLIYASHNYRRKSCNRNYAKYHAWTSGRSGLRQSADVDSARICRRPWTRYRLRKSGEPRQYGQEAQAINTANQLAQQQANAARLGPAGAAIQNQLVANTQAQAGGTIAPSTLNEMQAALAARGVQGGFGTDSPNALAAYTRAVGQTAEQEEQTAAANYAQLLAENPSAPIFDESQLFITPSQYATTADQYAASANQYAQTLAALLEQARQAQQTGAATAAPGATRVGAAAPPGTLPAATTPSTAGSANYGNLYPTTTAPAATTTGTFPYGSGGYQTAQDYGPGIPGLAQGSPITGYDANGNPIYESSANEFGIPGLAGGPGITGYDASGNPTWSAPGTTPDSADIDQLMQSLFGTFLGQESGYTGAETPPPPVQTVEGLGGATYPIYGGGGYGYSGYGGG